MGAFIYTFKLTLYYIILLLVSLFATFIGVVANLCGKRYNTNYYVARTFWHVAGPIVGWTFEITGEENFKDVETGKQPAVLLGNHMSALDILYLGVMFPKRASMMAKQELKWIPGLGWFMMLSGSIFINRSNNKSAVQLMQTAGEEMQRKKLSLWIFPEGTRHLTDEPTLLPFKKGAFHLAVQSGFPIIPVVCENYSKLLKKGKYFKRGTLKLKILPPIPTTGMTSADIPELIEKTRNVMLEALKEMSASNVPVTSSPLLTGTSKLANYDSVDSSDRKKKRKDAKQHLDEAGAPVASASSKTNGTKTTTTEVVDDDITEVGSEAAATDVASLKDSPKNSPKADKLTIAMVSDFFHPDIGGVEGHIYSLSVELMRRGHKVIVVTHHHKDRVGIRWLAPGLKVYHIPHVTIASSASLPNYLLFLPHIRTILLRERVDIVHGHATLSSLAHEAIHHAPLFGVRTCFTDHSLFGFADAVGVLTNKLLASVLRNVDAVICVSNTGRENTALRAEIEPERVSVIPNALVPSQFQPSPTPPSDTITIVVIARLVYRKGIDLLVASAPQICDMFPDVRFLVGGDGPKMVDLLQVREKYELQDKITLVGSVRPSEVIGLLNKGQIYLNTSLTEAFGISIIEAASAGLFVVSTKVGGVPEILPSDMIEFARADEDDVIRALSTAIATIRAGRHSPHKAHARVKEMYSWAAVAERTEEVYYRILATTPFDTWERLMRLRALGPIMGLIMCAIMAMQHWWLLLVQWYLPASEIDVVPRGWDQAQFADVVREEKETRV